MAVWVLVVILATRLLSPVRSTPYIEGMKQMCYSRQRDLNIALLVGLSRRIETSAPVKCSGRLRGPASVLFTESLKFGIDQVNANPNLLPNISLGYVVLDTCYHDLATLADMMYLVPDEHDTNLAPANGRPYVCQGGPPKRFDVVGTIGPGYSRSAAMVGGLSSIFQIPMVLTFASSDELSDKTRFMNVMRLVPPDRFQAEAMTDILVQLGWTYVALLYHEGAYGENGGKQLDKNAKKRGLCIAFRYMFPSDADESHAAEVVHKFEIFPAVRAVLGFISSSQLRLMKPLLIEKGLAGKLLWVGGDAFPSAASDDDPEMQLILDGAFSMTFISEQDPSFRSHFPTVTPAGDPDDPFLRDAWESLYECKWGEEGLQMNSSCESVASVPYTEELSSFAYEYYTMNGIHIYATALQAYLSDKCPEVFQDKRRLKDCLNGDELYQHMINVTEDSLGNHIKFDERGDFLGSYKIRQYNRLLLQREVVGHWDKINASLSLDWGKLHFNGQGNSSDERTIPESLCSQPCAPRQFYIQKELPCCWDCRYCRENEIVVENNTECDVCPTLTWPDEDTATRCETIPPELLGWTSPLKLALSGVTLLGVVSCVAISAVFARNHSHRLIKASSRQLMGIILAGIVLAYVTAFLLLLEPSLPTCYTCRFGFNLSVTLIYGPLMVKTSRIYRIFTAGKRGTKRPALIGTRAQLLMVVGLILLQIGVCLASVVQAPPIPILRMQVPTEKYVEALCSLPLSGLVPPLSVNLLFILVCAAYGFLTRKLPENFNESWYIFISVTTTTFLWLVFLPAYFTAFYAVHQVSLLSICLIINGSITLLCLYLPKIYCIYFIDEEKVQFQTAGTMGTTSVGPATSATNTGASK